VVPVRTNNGESSLPGQQLQQSTTSQPLNTQIMDATASVANSTYPATTPAPSTSTGGVVAEGTPINSTTSAFGIPDLPTRGSTFARAGPTPMMEAPSPLWLADDAFTMTDATTMQATMPSYHNLVPLPPSKEGVEGLHPRDFPHLGFSGLDLSNTDLSNTDLPDFTPPEFTDPSLLADVSSSTLSYQSPSIQETTRWPFVQAAPRRATTTNETFQYRYTSFVEDFYASMRAQTQTQEGGSRQNIIPPETQRMRDDVADEM